MFVAFKSCLFLNGLTVDRAKAWLCFCCNRGKISIMMYSDYFSLGPWCLFNQDSKSCPRDRKSVV